MNVDLKRMRYSVLGAALLLAAPLAWAGPGQGGGKIKGGGSAGCLQLGFAAEQVDDPGFDYAVDLGLTVDDRCQGERSEIGQGSATFEVRVNGQAACGPDQVDSDDLDHLEYSCELRLNEEDLPAQIEACITVEAEEVSGRKVSPMEARRCWSLDLRPPA